MQKPAIKVGARVRIVPQHWLRGYEEGCIIDCQLNLTNAWLVRFDRRFAGGGIEGDKLWLNESQFLDILPSTADAAPTHPVAQAESVGSNARASAVFRHKDNHAPFLKTSE